MALTEKEKAEWISRFHQELEKELELRERRRLAASDPEESERHQAAELAELKSEIQAQFYLDRGYVSYVDSRGQTHFVHPEEAERRQQRRRRRRRKVWFGKDLNAQRMWTVVLIVVAAILTALMVSGR